MRSSVTLFLILIFISCDGMKKPLVIGHRGAMGHETENSLASIQKAIDLGVDMIEIDVFKIKSGEIIVFHDDEVARLTNGTGTIESYDYANLLKLELKGGHKIPTLKEVLDLIDAKVMLNIELKGANTAAGVNEIIQYYIAKKGWKLDDFLISSFNWQELKDIRIVNKDIAIGILTEEEPLDAIPIAKQLSAVAINPNFENLNAENNLKIKEAGLKIYPWTVNEPQAILRMKRFAVDGIITNFPERIR